VFIFNNRSSKQSFNNQRYFLNLQKEGAKISYFIIKLSKTQAMKIKYIILLAGVAAFSSCSTAYRSGQTPDDVYYSPAPQENSNSYVSQPSSDDQDSYNYRNDEDNDIRSGINNPVYRSPLTLSMGFGYSPYSMYPYNSFSNPYGGYNNYGYSPYGLKSMYDPYSPFGYNDYSMYSPYNNFYSPYSLGFGYSPYNSGYGYGYGYSPYSYPLLNSSKSVNTNTGARKYNLGAYNNNGRSTSTESGIGEQPVRTATTQPTRGSGVGNVIRRVFSPTQRNTYTTPNNNNTRRSYNNNNERTNNSYRNDNQTPQRSFTPSTSTESSSPSSSSGGNAPVRSFRR